ncbi:hypothetical protein A2W14_04610 [Candidatus Gottesmanbacteria bacterium RBG_16_37_8]|uniref:Uncharacterized protein n=1 Tax=Candidatus Gottesmanbacteria bacterium RBG_16_37_8 TaxID=1798371 RepID=A0A1F5YSF2_9BACT|nr:MAG: hypothetical protein A2W14_04610 [Candidatus Gottesmanbacteria bacterium RBG_16_37_8]
MYAFYSSLVLGITAVIIYIVIRSKPWSKVLKLAILLSFLAIESRLPIFIYGNGCTFRTERDFSYLVPWGGTIVSKSSSDNPSYGGVIPFPPRFCTSALTPDFLSSHYLIADLAVVSWIIYFFSKSSIKKIVKV